MPSDEVGRVSLFESGLSLAVEGRFDGTIDYSSLCKSSHT